MNKARGSVRKAGRTGTFAFREGGDRRVRRTRQALTHALIDLVLVKRYHAITIQDLLDRADVGRSTFYSHYRGKDDLLLRSFEQMLDMLDSGIAEEAGPRGRIAPVRELFDHVGKFRRFHAALGRAHMLDRVYQAGTERVSRTIARRLDDRPHVRDALVPRAVMAQALAGALFTLLKWWLEEGAPYTSQRMDEMYHAILPKN